MFTLRMVYGPGLPAGEPPHVTESIIADIQRAMVEARKDLPQGREFDAQFPGFLGGLRS